MVDAARISVVVKRDQPGVQHVELIGGGLHGKRDVPLCPLEVVVNRVRPDVELARLVYRLVPTVGSIPRSGERLLRPKRGQTVRTALSKLVCRWAVYGATGKVIVARTFSRPRLSL